jgi:DNA polymerase I-like protein with 3'-5' exonuclease and polymerase domains
VNEDPIEDLIKEAGEKKLDIHMYVASKMFNCPYGEVTESMRRNTKTAIHLYLYGAKRRIPRR